MVLVVATSVALMALLGGHGAQNKAPRVVATSPAAGSIVSLGQLKLSVTFDRPMRAGNFSFVQKDPATYPTCGRVLPVQSSDGRTFTLACRVEPRRSYEVWFNSAPYMNFKGEDGTPALPFQLKFRTKN